MTKNTGRRPNIHWYTCDLQKNGFIDDLWAAGPDAIMGLYVPAEHLMGWLALSDAKCMEALGLTREEAVKLVEAHRPELTIRKDDEARTLATPNNPYNQSHTCPPDCS